VSKPPEDRNAELRALFFESAGELLQTLNEAGLELEGRPSDEETIRAVRRTVHTIKGDAAAAGFPKISELAHELEDILTPQVAEKHGPHFAEVVLAAADTFESMLAAAQRNKKVPSLEKIRTLIRRLLVDTASASQPGPVQEATATAGSGSAVLLPAQFAWTEYEQLMISEAVHRGESVFNVALRIDPNSVMRAAAFQLIRNVLHGCGTVIALRPEDNLAAASVEIVEAALATQHSETVLNQRCRIPSIVTDIRVERAAAAKTPEHELLGDILDAQAAAQEVANANANSAEHAEHAEAKPAQPASAAAAVAESTLRVESNRIDAVMNLVGELIIGKSMLQRAVAEFDRTHSRDPVRAKLADALGFQSRVLDELHKCVLKIRMVPVEQLFRRFPRVVRDVAKQCGKDVALEISGQNTDLDKSILDALNEPLCIWSAMRWTTASSRRMSA
jgi:two-component system, chemotaxis family, sensor kinase CheA